MIVLIDIFLWAIVGALALTAAVRSRMLLREGARDGVIDFLRLLPRLALGVVGSGFIAEAMPKDLIGHWLGPGSGMLGVLIAVIGGAVTPGGAVVGFSIGAAALKGGAGAPQVIAYCTAWALYALQRLVLWEMPVMQPRLVWLRALASLPLPFLAAISAMLIGKP
ncbi:MAG TPA: hypothetical protein VHA77_08400 [Xanthobacteraceae bacterium]|jgi:hypothetical protein|nr:hypothetical protein [Xanthobacteraceae bacterium]